MRADNTLPSTSYRNEQRGVIVEFFRLNDEPGFLLLARYSQRLGGGVIGKPEQHPTLNAAAARAQALIGEHGVTIANELLTDLAAQGADPDLIEAAEDTVAVRGDRRPVGEFAA